MMRVQEVYVGNDPRGERLRELASEDGGKVNGKVGH